MNGDDPGPDNPEEPVLPDSLSGASEAAAPRSKNRLALWGGGFQVLSLIFFALFTRYQFGDQDFLVRFSLFSFFHIILFFFCVFARRLWLVIATAVASLLVAGVDLFFLWYLSQVPGAVLDTWMMSSWLMIKLLPVLSLIFLFFWLSSVQKLKNQGAKTHAKIR